MIFALYYVIDEFIPGSHQPFSLRNYTLQYPHASHERLTLTQTVWITLAGPAAVIFLYSVVLDGFLINRSQGQYLPRHSLFKVRERRSQRRVQGQLWDFNCAWLGLGLSYALAFIIMVVLKRMTGKPRPDLIARCLPKPGSRDAEPFGLSNISICMQPDKKLLHDGFMSWPSGHCSGTSIHGLCAQYVPGPRTARRCYLYSLLES